MNGVVIWVTAVCRSTAKTSRSSEVAEGFEKRDIVGEAGGKVIVKIGEEVGMKLNTQKHRASVLCNGNWTR